MKKLLILVLISGSLLNADQFWSVSKENADKALVWIANADSLYDYCAPCENSKPKLINVKSVSIKKRTTYEGFHVEINNTAEDLAYIYFFTDGGKWKNLAIHIGLNPSGVPINIFNASKTIVYKTDIEHGSYILAITNMNNDGFYFKASGVSGSGSLCDVSGQAYFKNTKYATSIISMEEDYGDCTIWFNTAVDEDKIEVSAKGCGAYYCGVGASFAQTYFFKEKVSE